MRFVSVHRTFAHRGQILQYETIAEAFIHSKAPLCTRIVRHWPHPSAGRFESHMFLNAELVLDMSFVDTLHVVRLACEFVNKSSREHRKEYEP